MQRLFSNFFSWYSVHISRIFFFTLYLFLAIIFIERFLIIFSYEAHTAGIDNNFDYAIVRSLAGYNIYPDPSAYPYAVNPYAPLFFIVCKCVAVFFNVAASDTIGVYRVSRAVSLMADAGTCLLLFDILYKSLKISRPVSIAITTLFIGIVSYLGYTINRSDSLFLLFYCSTVACLFKRPSGKPLLHICTTSILATLCIFSKQNGISLFLLVPAWFFIEKNYRCMLQFLLFASFFCIALFFYFEYHYTDHFFSEHIINALKNKIDIRWLYVYVVKLMADSYIILPLVIALIISIKSIAPINNILLKKAGVIFLLQFIFSTGLCLKWGSSRGYYNESFLLSFIVMAIDLGSVQKYAAVRIAEKIGTYIYPALLLFMFQISAQHFFFFLNSNSEARIKFAEQVKVSNYLKREIGPEKKYVVDLSNPDFNFFKTLLFKESAAPNMDAVNCCTLPDSIFNYKGLTEGLKSGKIAFLIENKTTVVKNRWGIDLQHYRLDTSFTVYSIYKYDSSLNN